jgi:hypothetical protein
MEKEPLQYKVLYPLFFAGGGLGTGLILNPVQKKNAHTKYSKNFCSTRNQVAKLFIRRKFIERIPMIKPRQLSSLVKSPPENAMLQTPKTAFLI